MREYNILLLTNRDSDNVGDQVIEACDIALIKAVMKNLNIDKSEYKIKSHAASIVTKQYMKTREEKYLEKAQAQTKVIFGGRLGMYKYFDMHQVVKEALNCVRKELEIM